MERISEHNIEQYIRFPEELSEHEKKEIEKAISESEETQKLYEFLSAFYEELDEVVPNSATVIPLKLFQSEEYHSGPVVLAAMTSDPTSTTLETKATLFSDEQKTLVRILENKADNSLQFHVIGQNRFKCERAILSILKPELDLVTNEKGKLKDVRDLSNIRWNKISALLRVPVFKSTIAYNETVAPHTLLDVSGANIRVELRADKLILQFDKKEHKLTRVLLVQGRRTELKRIIETTVEFFTTGNDKLSLYFYE
ncbi:MAG: hypothetical protein WD607_11615 [Candidatus Paceibacterota bacterium]